MAVMRGPVVRDCMDESFVSTVGEDEEWEDSGEWGQVGGAPWEMLGVR